MNTLTRILSICTLFMPTELHAQYCMLPGRVPYDTHQPGITFFRLNGINRSSAAVESMSAVVVETGDTTTLVRGRTYRVLITHSRDSILFPTVTNNIRVWIDYNQNYSFNDTGELVAAADTQMYGLFGENFIVPATAPLGYTRFRATAKMSAGGGHIPPSACDSPMDSVGYHGEMEDYIVNIAAPVEVPQKLQQQVSISVFPNPSQGEIGIAFGSVTNEPLSIQLCNITGKITRSLLDHVPQSEPAYSFPASKNATSASVYLLRVELGEQVTYHRMSLSQ